ncbi:MAG: hypothetical protein ACOYT8_04475 [Candidatus Dependentiae bacterium]
MKFVSLFLSMGILFTGFIGSNLNAHFFKVKRWANGSHEIVTVSDYHTSFGTENKIGAEQRKDLVAAAKLLDAVVIAEDMLIAKKRLTENPREYHKTNQIVSIESVNKVAPEKTPLYGLVSACDHAGVKAFNAEFRQAKRGSFDGFIQAEDAVAASESVLNEIKSYRDGKTFDNFYRTFLNRYEKEIYKPCKSVLNFAAQNKGTFSELIKSLSEN